MSATVITSPVAMEEGTYVLTFTFLDEAGAAMTPTALNEQLTDLSGTTINGIDRSITPSSVQTIVYSATALTLAQGVGRKRLCTLTGTYNSTYGSALSLVATAEFEIVSVVTVP